jgi:exodeoxyribonuclease V alpha subunit
MTEPTPTIHVNRLADLLKKNRPVLVAPHVPNTLSEIKLPESVVVEHTHTNQYGTSISYNHAQNQFIQTALQGKSCILIGAAGTGKTTCMKGVATALIQSGAIQPMNDITHKHLKSGAPGIIFCAYTRRATGNIRRAVSDDLKDNCITIHKLLEYEPVYDTVEDPETGKEKRTMSFLPSRDQYNPLPESIHTIVIDESSMVSVELFKEITNALSHAVQFIFLGDIQQLPPVFGSAILGYKMLELPTVELTEVYRQALESPIIRLAHRILSGLPIPADQFEQWNIPEQLKLHPWKKKLHSETACLTFSKFITQAYDHKSYNPDSDIILIPFNKAFGTDEVNKQIANHIARSHNLPTYEIISGYEKYYFSVGDKILVEKEDATISAIIPNPLYAGKPYQAASPTLDYWGYNSGVVVKAEHTLEEIDTMLDNMAGDSDERVKQASHIIKYKRPDSETEFEITSAAVLNAVSLGYAITVHKSQGSEWDKVFLVFHQSHSTMLQRELLYTAVTRAKKELYVICEPESFEKGITSQRIKGNSLAEKAEFFKGKLDQNGGVY